jgi:hypothetical protein
MRQSIGKKKGQLAQLLFFSMSAPSATLSSTSSLHSPAQLFVLEGVILDKSISKQEYLHMYPSNDYTEALLQQRSAFTFVEEDGTNNSDLMGLIVTQATQWAASPSAANTYETSSSVTAGTSA